MAPAHSKDDLARSAGTPADGRLLPVVDRAALALAALASAALGFLALNEPWVSDDFNNALFVRQHPGFWNAMVRGYESWSGRFSGSAVSWLAIHTRPIYGIAIWAGLMLLVVMTFTLALGRMPKPKRADLWILGVLLLAYWFALPALEETVFWAAGSPVYLWPAVATLGLLYPYRRWDPKNVDAPLSLPKELALSGGMLLLGAFVGGSQEQVLAACLLFFGIVALAAARAGALRRIPAHLYAGAVGLVLAGAVSLAAPGNFVRLSATPSSGVVATAIGAAKYLVHIGVDWFPPLVPWLLLVALLVTGGEKPVARWGRARIAEWWVWLLLGVATLSPLLVKPYFGAERTTMFLAVFLLVSVVSLGKDGLLERAAERLPAAVASAVLAGVFLIALADVGLSGWQARELRSGQRERAALIETQKARGVLDVSVPPLTDEQPRRGVAFGDGTGDSAFWLNGILANYYGVNSLVIKREP